MQAISVRYIPPGNTTSARWRVRCDAFNYLLPYAHECSGEEAAREALKRALERFELKYRLRYGRGLEGTPWRWPHAIGQLHDGTYVAVGVEPARAGEAVSK
jgi:hypothetical protein